MASFAKRSSFAAAAAAVATACLFGQTFTGTVAGTVTDTTNASVPGATVTLTNTVTGESRKAVSSELGRFTFSQVSPSTYQVNVSQQGFHEYVRKDIPLTTNQSVDLHVELSVGELSQKLEVSAVASLLDTQTATKSVTVGQDLLQAIPLGVRNVLGMASVTSGIVGVKSGAWSQGTTDQGQNRFAMAGGRNTTAAVLVDGISVVSGDWGGAVALPGIDAVQEVQVIRNTYEAQFGRSGGGVLNISTRSGSAQFHGQVSEYLSNDNLNANDFFSNKFGTPKTEAKQNQFGGALGGPIWNSRRVYGYFAYEGLRSSSPTSRTATVPTDLQRKGDFSQSLNPDGTPTIVYDSLTTAPDAARPGKFIRSAFPGNIVPAARFDPVGLNVAKGFTAPNQPGQARTQANNFYDSGSSIVVNNRYDARVDWARSSMHTLFGRFTIARQKIDRPLLFEKDLETAANVKHPRFQVSIGNTFVLSPTLVVNALVGGGRWNEQQVSTGWGYDGTTIGLPAAVARQFDVPSPPRFNLGDYTAIGGNAYISSIRNLMNAQVNVTKDKGTHSIKFGWNWEACRYFVTNTSAPTFSFDRFMTSGPDPDLRTANSGNSVASLLLGYGTSGTLLRNARPASIDPYMAWYLQDAWKVNRRVTLSYGLRYEISFGRKDRFNRLTRFNYDIANPIGEQARLPLKGGLQYVTPDDRTMFDTDFNNLAPRVGIAVKLAPKLVFRSGYGIFFWKPASSSGTPNKGYDGYSVSTPWVATLDGRTPNDRLSNPFPDGIRPAPGSSAGLLTNVGFAINAAQRNMPSPYVQQYSADFQYELRPGLVLEAGYSGNQGRKLSYGYVVQMNQLPESAMSLGDALLVQVPNPFFGLVATGTLAAKTVQRGQLLRPYPQFTGVGINDMPGASSSYNAAVISLTKRFSRGLSFAASYQFSKAMDNASENTAGDVGDDARNYNNLSLERSISAHDLPHSLATSFVYELPVGRSRAFGAKMGRTLDAVAGGWTLSGVYKLDSGLPLRFTAPNNTFSSGGNQVPNVTSYPDATVSNPTPDLWFNTKAFSQPAPYTFGTVPRWFSNIRFSRLNQWMLAVSKTFRIGERVRAQLRGEFFNAFNAVQFGRADTTLGSRTFGQVSTLAPGGDPRNVQLGLRIAF